MLNLFWPVYFTDRSKAVLLLWIICVFVSCASHAFASVHCCLAVTCWERADLLALVGDVYCIFVTFQCGILSQVLYLIVSFPDLCRLSYMYFDRFALIAKHSQNLTESDKKIFSRTPDRVFRWIYPCEIILSQIPTHTRSSDPYVSSLSEKSFSHTNACEIEWSLCKFAVGKICPTSLPMWDKRN